MKFCFLFQISNTFKKSNLDMESILIQEKFILPESIFKSFLINKRNMRLPTHHVEGFIKIPSNTRISKIIEIH